MCARIPDGKNNDYESFTNELVKLELKNLVNLRKMRRLVREFGCFPTKHRCIIWRYILNLPDNSNNFREIVTNSCGIQLPESWNKWIDCNDEFEHFMKISLHRLLRWLVLWSPKLSSSTFLPEFVVPFVKLFSSDPISCFEAVATIIGQWGVLWLELQPLPPFDLMRITEQLVQQYAPGAFKILKQNMISVAAYAWPLLEHGFARVLCFEDWCQLWDHFLCNHPKLIISASVAYICVTESRLRICTKNNQDLKEFYHQPWPIDMRCFLKKSYEIMDNVINWPASLMQPVIHLTGATYPKL